MPEIDPQGVYLRRLHLEQADQLRSAWDRIRANKMTEEDLLRTSEWELWECIYSLQPEAPSNGAIIDGWHASACAFRAAVALMQLRERRFHDL